MRKVAGILKTNDTLLFTTIVGSHVWGMNTAESDLDLSTVYVSPTRDMLRGIPVGKNKFQAGEVDNTMYEIGAFIEGLIKYKINTTTVAISPVEPAYSYGNYLKEISTIVHANVSKDIFYSTHGLGDGNYKKYIIGRNEVDNQKRINQICRTLQFGIHALETGKLKFAPYVGTVEEIPDLLREIQVARINSSLPEHADSEPFREFLYDVRIKELNGEL